ncbi:polysaccharide deacetylase family protein [Streptomyces sp. NBUL23]|uniref:polysaccharide deacetylase family protein n=1 Tax=Streptomyces sp. NBUL23 TaxID=3381354 RepID=UPI003872A5FE
MSDHTHRRRGASTVRRTVVTTTAAVLFLAGTAAITMTVDSGDEATSSKAAGPGAAATPAPPTPVLSIRPVDPAIVRESEGTGKTVNLTLDDGPDPRWTPQALELLKRHKARAVFCVTGPNAAAHPDLVKRIVAEGHRLCNHAVSHDTAMDKKPVAYQQKEVLDAKEMIDRASDGARIWYYRAPGGAFTPASRQYAAAHGMRNLGWNVDPGDFNQPGADTIVRAVKNQLAKGPTILLHDGGGYRAQTIEAMEQLLPWLTGQGYAFSFPRAT